jgi:hypothetical protein
LYPWNPQKAPGSSQVKPATAVEVDHNNSESEFCPPSTPKRSRPHSLDDDITHHPLKQTRHDTLFPTPKHPRHIYTAVKKCAKPPTADQRVILHKASKAIGRLTTKQALTEACNRKLQSQLEELQSRQRKKKITVDPNSLFANVDAIKLAMDEAAKAQEEKEKREKEK